MLMFLISSMFSSVTFGLRILKWSSRDFYLYLNYDLLWGTTPPTTFVGWMARVRLDCLTKGSNKTQFKLSFGKINQFFFDPAHWWWPKVTFFFAYLAKEGRSGSQSKWPLRSWFCISGGMKSPLPPPLSGIPSGTKPRHKKATFLSLVIHKATAVNEWHGKTFEEIDKINFVSPPN